MHTILLTAIALVLARMNAFMWILACLHHDFLNRLILRRQQDLLLRVLLDYELSIGRFLLA